MKPSGKCFLSGPRGYFSFESSYSTPEMANLLGVVGGFFKWCFVYDADGRKWQPGEVQSAFRDSWWTRLLANTIYNPQVKVNVIWNEPQTYTLTELKRTYSDAVDKDDDILTQFVEPEELKKRILAATSFEQLVQVYKWMETDQTEG